MGRIRDLRRQIAAYLRSREDLGPIFMAGLKEETGPSGYLSKSRCHSWEDYLALVESGSTMADNFVMLAAANVLRMSIHVKRENKWRLFEPDAPAQRIVKLLNHSEHFDVVVDIAV